jgi:hypothetical protein
MWGPMGGGGGAGGTEGMMCRSTRSAAAAAGSAAVGLVFGLEDGRWMGVALPMGYACLFTG